MKHSNQTPKDTLKSVGVHGTGVSGNLQTGGLPHKTATLPPPSQTPQSTRVGLISLGCAKNLVDGELMLGALLNDGIQIVSDPALADVVIVNTCSFIDSAQEESVDAILESAEARRQTNPGQALVVAGCLPQRFREELVKLLPEVDAFAGIDQVPRMAGIIREALARRKEIAQSERPAQATGRKRKVMERISHLQKDTPFTPIVKPAAPLFEVNQRPTFIPDFAMPRLRLTPSHLAYVKIAEGCNHPCSFCIIPQIRGSHRSRPQADIVAEARQLIEQGVKELNLISQDSTYYGMDLRASASRAISSPEKFSATTKALPGGAATLSSLIEELNALPGNFWIRLLYTHPAHWTDDLIRAIERSPKVARYIDMPLQHIHPAMLERMRRETSREYIIDLIARIRAGIPGIALRTTFIVGFPGETDEAFESLLDFMRETRFERAGVFAYSREEGTRAGKMESQVPDRVKKQRQKRAMIEQRKIARAVAAASVGRTMRVLIERPAGSRDLENAGISSWEHGLIRQSEKAQAVLETSCLIARGEADAPDIDGRVYVKGKAPIGHFAEVKIIGHTDYDLLAEVKTTTSIGTRQV